MKKLAIILLVVMMLFFIAVLGCVMYLASRIKTENPVIRDYKLNLAADKFGQSMHELEKQDSSVKFYPFDKLSVKTTGHFASIVLMVNGTQYQYNLVYNNTTDKPPKLDLKLAAAFDKTHNRGGYKPSSETDSLAKLFEKKVIAKIKK